MHLDSYCIEKERMAKGASFLHHLFHTAVIIPKGASNFNPSCRIVCYKGIVARLQLSGFYSLHM